MGNIYGYARVSTREQNEDRQLIALQEVRVPKQNIKKTKKGGSSLYTEHRSPWKEL